MPDETAKHDSDLVIVKNEDGETEYGLTLEDAVRRLNASYQSKIIRAARAVVHMSAPAVENGGDLVIPDAALAITKLEARDC